MYSWANGQRLFVTCELASSITFSSIVYGFHPPTPSWQLEVSQFPREFRSIIIASPIKCQELGEATHTSSSMWFSSKFINRTGVGGWCGGRGSTHGDSILRPDKTGWLTRNTVSLLGFGPFVFDQPSTAYYQSSENRQLVTYEPVRVWEMTGWSSRLQENYRSF